MRQVLISRIWQRAALATFYQDDDRLEDRILSLKERHGYPDVLSLEETIETLQRTRWSFSRYGDGEFSLILGHGIRFQAYDKTLSRRLREVLMHPGDQCLVGIPTLEKGKIGRYFLEYWFRNLKAVTGLLNSDLKYGLSQVTRFAQMDELAMLSKLWDHSSKVVFVVGKGSRFDHAPFLFDNIDRFEFVYSMAENAWSCYPELLECLCSEAKDTLFLLSLGPTATVLAHDLSLKGYRALDIGHVSSRLQVLQGKVVRAEAIPTESSE